MLAAQQSGRHKTGCDPVQFGLGDGVGRTVLGQDALVLGFHRVHIHLAFGLHQNFDARFVLVVAATKAVVNTHHGLEVVDDLVPGQKFAYDAASDGRAPHAATHHHPETDLACGIAMHLQAHIVPSRGSAVFLCAADGDFEFAGQKSELGMQGAPLPQDFSKGAGVHDFIHRHTRAFVGGDVANAVATGLNAVHVHGGQEVHHVSAFLQRNPVVLQVLSGGEVGIAMA